MMSNTITMVGLAIALAGAPIAVKAHKHHAGVPTQELAQYCMPPDNQFPGASKIYC